VLTGNIVPDDSILLLIEGWQVLFLLFLSKAVPIILLIKLGYKAKIYADNKQKIETSINTFEKYVDLDNLTKIKFFWSGRMTPKMFQYNLVKRG
jgi:phosphate acetyltransferase